MVTGYDRTYRVGEWGSGRFCFHWWGGVCFVVDTVMCIMTELVNGTCPRGCAWRRQVVQCAGVAQSVAQRSCKP